jgi:hypothetical protein
MDPCHTAGMPEKAQVYDGAVDYGDGEDSHGRSPKPGAVDEHPTAVMVGDVTERLGWNPCLVTMIMSPAACCVRLPSGFDPRGPPHVILLIFILHGFPPAVIFERISLIVEALGKILNGLSFYFQSLCPNVIPALIPFVPLGVHRSVAPCDTGGIGQDGILAGEHFVSCAVLLVDEIHHPLESHHLSRFIAYVKIEG